MTNEKIENIEELENATEKWLIEIIDDKPHSYMDMMYLNPNIKYFEKSIEVNKADIEIEKLHLYKLKNGKLVKDKTLEKDIKEQEKQERLTVIKKELSALKVEFSEMEFIYKGKYLQKNREKGDRDNLTSIILMLIVSKQNFYDGWKVLDKDTREHVYLKLSIDDLKVMAFHMQEQVTKAMKTESILLKKLESLTEKELKEFNSRREYTDLWKQN